MNFNHSTDEEETTESYQRLTLMTSINHKKYRQSDIKSITMRNRMLVINNTYKNRFEQKLKQAYLNWGFPRPLFIPQIQPQSNNYSPILMNLVNNQQLMHIGNNKIIKQQKIQEKNKNYRLVNEQNLAQLKPKYQYTVKQTFSNGYIMFTKCLGSGSFGEVYLGMDTNNNNKVAIKIINKKFQNQVLQMKKINCRYILELYAAWKQKNHVFMALELCDGNLAEKLKKGASFDQRLRYCKDILNGAAYLGRKGIIHRDLKLENILTKNDEIKIADLGFAKQLSEQQLTVMSLRCGTPSTMAPEIFFKPDHVKLLYNKKCDVWSLGVIIHQLIYKVHPFDCNVQRLRKNRRIKIQKPFQKIEYILSKTLVYQPENRISLDQLLLLWDELKINQQPFKGVNFIKQIRHQKQFQKQNNNEWQIQMKKKQHIENKVSKNLPLINKFNVIKQKQIKKQPVVQNNYNLKNKYDLNMVKQVRKINKQINYNNQLKNVQKIQKINKKSSFKQNTLILILLLFSIVLLLFGRI